MEAFKDYTIAELTQAQIDVINNAQGALKQNTSEEIVLIAYKKNKAAN